MSPPAAEKQNVPDAAPLTHVAAADELWNLVRGSSPAEVLRRYFGECASARFGVYWDTPDENGRVAAIDGTPRRWPHGTARSALLSPRKQPSRRGEGA